MNYNIGLLLSTLLIILHSCNEKNIQQEKSKEETKLAQKEYYFKEYFEETFNDIPTEGYYVILGKKMCASCESGVFESFSNLQRDLYPEKIKIISDFTPDNPIFIDKFKQNVLQDTLANFENYLLPRSYITFYKISNGEIISFAHITEKEKLNNFLKQENLIPQH